MGEISLYINSPGGSVDSGMALYDVMQAVSCPIRTVCVGLAASMAALLFVSGSRREMLPHSRLMIHDPLILQTGGSALKLKAVSDDLLVGPSGAGKTRGYVIPNLLHAGESLIVADTKGNLRRLYGKHLEEKGYTVMHLDFTDVASTPWGYNPLSYIRPCRDAEANRDGDWYSEQDVKKVAQAICPCLDFNEPYWDLAAQMYLEAILLFLLNQLPEEQHTLYEAYTFLSRMGSPELEDMVEEERITHPDSAFARKIGMIRQNKKADKMDASIKGILARHLDVLANSGTRRMFRMERQVDLGAFLKGRTALFLSVSDSDRSQDALVNLFYTQALQYLMAAADRQPDSRLPIPVRFILDDFSTNTVIPEFDKTISVIRSREIYVSLIVQSLSQLEDLYGHAKAQTIINNCDHCLYLGGTDTQTARYFAEANFGKECGM